MAREQQRKQTSSHDSVSRRTYLRLSGAAAVGAATAVGASRTAIEPQNVLTGVGTTPQPSTFEVTVSERIVPGKHTDALSVLGTTGLSAEDAVAEGVRSYRFAGEVTDLRVDDGASVFVNGARVEPTRFSR